MSQNVGSAGRRPCIGTKKMKLAGYTDNARSVNEFIKKEKGNEMEKILFFFNSFEPETPITEEQFLKNCKTLKIFENKVKKELFMKGLK